MKRQRLLYSSKFWLAVFGLVQAVVLHYLNVPEEIWQAVAGLIAVAIAGMAFEDAAKKAYQKKAEGVEP
jgi:hypothetical protein